jgi:hypothetical protein
MGHRVQADFLGIGYLFYADEDFHRSVISHYKKEMVGSAHPH